jgi:hypothetical protein
MSREETDLATHVDICAIRYLGIQEKIHGIERRLDKMEADLHALKTSTQQGFNDIKLLLEQRNTQKQTQVLASAATIIVALLGVIGYYVSKH